MTPPVIHRVTTLDLHVAAAAVAVRGRAARRDRRAFRAPAAREAAAVERPRAAGTQSGVRRRSLQRRLFRDRFRQLPGLARLGLSGPGACSTALAWARCAAPTARSCSAKWASTPPMPGGSISRPARPISTMSRDGKVDIAGSVAARDRGRNRPDAGGLSRRRALGLRGRRVRDRDDQDIACRYDGRSAARADRGQSRPAASAGTGRHPSGARGRRSHRGDAALCHGVSRAAICEASLSRHCLRQTRSVCARER